MSTEDERLITVCSACKQASCWQGKFYCEKYLTAGTILVAVSVLRKWNLEHPDYWHPDCEDGIR